MKSKTLIFIGLAALLSLGFAKKQKDSGKIWVATYDGSKQCQKETTSVSDSKGRKALENADIVVYESKKSHDGKMRAAVCGNETGAMNAFLISEDDFEAAQKLGFKKN